MGTLCRMYSDRVRFDRNDYYMLMRMIFGGQGDQYDYHNVASNEVLLVYNLSEAASAELHDK